jgi:hypothetical protein
MSRRDKDGIWLETDYEQEGVLSLEFATQQLEQVLDDAYRWKWVIIGLHNSLQAFMVMACSGSDQMGAMTDAYRNHWYDHYRNGKPLTQRPRLLNFITLFSRVKDLKRYVDTKSLTPSAIQSSAVRSLNSWRDDFIHYKPGSMSIEVSGFPDIIARSLEVIEFLAFRSMNVFRTADEWSRRTAASLASSRDALASSAASM